MPESIIKIQHVQFLAKHGAQYVHIKHWGLSYTGVLTKHFIGFKSLNEVSEKQIVRKIKKYNCYIAFIGRKASTENFDWEFFITSGKVKPILRQLFWRGR